MARVTVEDCVTRIPNRFELVLLAARRARDLAMGAPLMVERDRDKNPVVALREIAEGKLADQSLRDKVIRNFQNNQEKDEPETEDTVIRADVDVQSLAKTLTADVEEEEAGYNTI